MEGQLWKGGLSKTVSYRRHRHGRLGHELVDGGVAAAAEKEEEDEQHNQHKQDGHGHLMRWQLGGN